MPPPEELWVERPGGLEAFEIESATWNLYRDEDHAWDNLWLSVKAPKPRNRRARKLAQNPDIRWEVNLVERRIEERVLENTFSRDFSGYDEMRGGWVATFFYLSHGRSDRNLIKLHGRKADKLLVEIRAEVESPSVWEDIRQPTNALVRTWFTRDPDGRRSMA